MRILFLMLLLLSSAAHASSKTVIAKGYGVDEPAAIRDAKSMAIRMVLGEWINSSDRLSDDLLESKTISVSTGTVKSFEILSSNARSNGIYVEIKAEVVDRESNSIATSAKDVNFYAVKDHTDQIIKNMKELEIGIKSLDDINQALIFEISDLEFSPINTSTIALKVTGDLKFQKKWKNDYLELFKKSKKSEYEFAQMFRISNCGEDESYKWRRLVGFDIEFLDSANNPIPNSLKLYSNLITNHFDQQNSRFDWSIGNNWFSLGYEGIEYKITKEQMEEIKAVKTARVVLYCPIWNYRNRDLKIFENLNKKYEKK